MKNYISLAVNRFRKWAYGSTPFSRTGSLRTSSKRGRKNRVVQPTALANTEKDEERFVDALESGPGDELGTRSKTTKYPSTKDDMLEQDVRVSQGRPKRHNQYVQSVMLRDWDNTKHFRSSARTLDSGFPESEIEADSDEEAQTSTNHIQRKSDDDYDTRGGSADIEIKKSSQPQSELDFAADNSARKLIPRPEFRQQDEESSTSLSSEGTLDGRHFSLTSDSDTEIISSGSSRETSDPLYQSRAQTSNQRTSLPLPQIPFRRGIIVKKSRGRQPHKKQMDNETLSGQRLRKAHGKKGSMGQKQTWTQCQRNLVASPTVSRAGSRSAQGQTTEQLEQLVVKMHVSALEMVLQRRLQN